MRRNRAMTLLKTVTMQKVTCATITVQMLSNTPRIVVNLFSAMRLPNEVELAAALGVSAVTAREALSQLRGQGIIRTVRGRSGGSFIAEDVLPSPERGFEWLRGLTRLQSSDLGLHYQAVAAACAGVAAKRSDAADVETLRSYIRPETDDALSWRLVSSEFLLKIAAIARSARLARELLRIQAEPSRCCRSRTRPTPGRRPPSTLTSPTPWPATHLTTPRR